MSFSEKRNWSRRGFVKTAVTGAIVGSLPRIGVSGTEVMAGEAPSSGEQKLWNGEPGVLHMSPAPRGSMVYRGDGSVILFSVDTIGGVPVRQAAISHDEGQTWGQPFIPKNQGGGDLIHNFQASLRLSSGKIAVV